MLKGVLTGMHHYIVCNTSQNIVSESCNKPNQNIFGMLELKVWMHFVYSYLKINPTLSNKFTKYERYSTH